MTPPDSTPEDAILQGLSDRVRNLLRALDRQDRLETAQQFAGWLARQEAEGLADAAREVLLRALARAGDPVNYRILRRLDRLAAVELPELMAATGLGRVAVSERVHDLVQTGLASREMVGDQIRGTALGEGLVALIEGVCRRSGERLAEELAG